MNVRRLRLRLIAACGLFVCLAAGCENVFGSRLRDDPLLGIPTPAAPIPPPIPPSSTPQAQASAPQVPPLPTSHTAPGTVAMASGETASPENARDLRMTTPPASTVSRPSTGAARGLSPVTVGKPEPAPTGAAPNMAAPPASTGLAAPKPASPAPNAASSNIRSFDEAQRVLKQKGVNWQYLSGEEQNWKFSCGIPNPKSPNLNTIYQTSKPFPDPLSAMQEVIAKIEQTPR